MPEHPPHLVQDPKKSFFPNTSSENCFWKTSLIYFSFHPFNSFHHIAHNYGSIGIESVKEIISLTDKLVTPTMSIPVIGDERTAIMLNQTIVNTMFKDVVEESSVEQLGFYECDTESDRQLNDVATSMVPINCHFIRFLLQSRILTTRGLSPEYVREAVCHALNSVNPHSCVVLASDTNMDDWVLHVYVPNIDTVMEHALKKSVLKIDQAELGDARENVLRSIELTLLQKVRLCGIEGVNDVFYHTKKVDRVNSSTGEITTKLVHILETAGCSFQQALTLQFVDWRRITCNSMKAIHESLGIQAMSVALFNEIKRQLSSNGKKVDDRYIALLADFITCQGYPVSITRFDMNEIPTTGDLDKATFEQPMQVLTNAAGIGKHSPLSGASSSVLVGKQFNLGTGMVKLLNNASVTKKNNNTTNDAQIPLIQPRAGVPLVNAQTTCTRPGTIYPRTAMEVVCASTRTHYQIMNRLGDWKTATWQSQSVLAEAMESTMYSPTRYCPSSPAYCPSSPPPMF